MELRSLGGIARLLAAALGGYATTFAFAPYDMWLLAPAGIALLIAIVRYGAEKSARAGFIYGMAWGLAFFLPHLDWADFAVGPAPWLLLAGSQGAFIGLAAGVWALLLRYRVVILRLTWQVTSFAILWTASEELRSNVPFGGFPWGRIAFSQVDAPAGKLAWLGGAPLVTFVTVMAGAAFGIAAYRIFITLRLLRVREPAGLMFLSRAITVGIAFPVIFLTIGAVIPLANNAEDGTLRVGAVQGNVPGQGLDAFERQRIVLNNHVEETHKLAARGEDLDLVVWPENATDIDPKVDAEAYEAIDAAAAEVDAPLLVGAVRAVGESNRINISLLWEAGIGETESYVKQHPAPFGEYIPFRSIARLVSKDADRIQRDMIGGEEVGVVPLLDTSLGREVSLGDVICFEVAYDGIVRESIAAGGELLIVQTNNATFGFTNESVQQLAMSRLRAIEHGRATLQISTVGVSAFIDPDGAVTQRTGHYTAEQMISDMKLRTTLTPATLFGNWIAFFFNLGAVLIVLGIAASFVLNKLVRRAMAA
ncbi:MAG TPA: apolipoprotein N-acyltransferase, partial [Actinomycetales bacterium]|nr:apolipoprotein N-acyltransferase [Actinomycetales bacterium]